jgi:hypothetical protein
MAPATADANKADPKEESLPIGPGTSVPTLSRFLFSDSLLPGPVSMQVVPALHTFPIFLGSLLCLSQEDRDALEVPLTQPELVAAVEEAAPNMLPGLDGQSYEFYCAIPPLVGPPSFPP